jgi:hypothetical protein
MEQFLHAADKERHYRAERWGDFRGGVETALVRKWHRRGAAAFQVDWTLVHKRRSLFAMGPAAVTQRGGGFPRFSLTSSLHAGATLFASAARVLGFARKNCATRSENLAQRDGTCRSRDYVPPFAMLQAQASQPVNFPIKRTLCLIRQFFTHIRLQSLHVDRWMRLSPVTAVADWCELGSWPP